MVVGDWSVHATPRTVNLYNQRPLPDAAIITVLLSVFTLVTLTCNPTLEIT